MPAVIFSAAVFIALEAFSLAYGHSYPHWSKIIGKTLPDPKRLITNYTYGILSIFIPYQLWLGFILWFGLEYSLLIISVGMWVFIGAGGATVKFLYWHDGIVKMRDTLETKEIELNAEHHRQR